MWCKMPTDMAVCLLAAPLHSPSTSAVCAEQSLRAGNEHLVGDATVDVQERLLNEVKRPCSAQPIIWGS